MSTQLHKVYSRTVSWFSRKEVICIYIFRKNQANITGADRIMFYTDREKLLKNTLIFRPMLEHQWAHRQDVTSSKEMLLSSWPSYDPPPCTQEKQLFLITGDGATPYPTRWCGDHQHTNGGKELNQLNPIQIWEGSFTLYDPYFVQSALSGEKIGMNTSKIFTLLIKGTFAQSIWEMAKI